MWSPCRSSSIAYQNRGFLAIALSHTTLAWRALALQQVLEYTVVRASPGPVSCEKELSRFAGLMTACSKYAHAKCSLRVELYKNSQCPAPLMQPMQPPPNPLPFYRWHIIRWMALCGTTLPAHLSRVPVAPPLTCDATSLTASPPHLRPRTTIYRSLCLLPRLSQKGSGLRLQMEAALTAPPMRSNLRDDVSAAAWARSKVATPPLLSEQCHSSTGCSGSGVAPARGARRRHCL